jgi:hypothetical protein
MCGLTKKYDGIGVRDGDAEGDGYRYQEKEGVEICLQSAASEAAKPMGSTHDPKSATLQP